MKKIKVGSRELKTRLGTYLRQVRKGRTLVVTDRGRPVAELKPIDVDADGELRRLDELVLLGILSRDSHSPLAQRRPLRISGRPLSGTVVENREDRV